MKTLTKELQAAITPEMALNLLKEGNHRFMNKVKSNSLEEFTKFRLAKSLFFENLL